MSTAATPSAPISAAPPSKQRIAVIGAGIAGLACAGVLARAGHAIDLFDKGRRPGGRVATRRAGGAMFDHGAQFATARTSEFSALMQKLEAAEIMAPWPAAARSDDVAWVGRPGMSALPGAMANALSELGVTLHAERHAAWLHPDNTLRHLPASEAKPGSTTETGGEQTAPYDAILLALPAPQAIPLLATRNHAFAHRLGPVAIAPCWAVMASFAAPLDAPDVMRPTSGPLAWIARNSARPGQKPLPDTWVLHAGAAWTRAHLEDSATDVATALLAEFQSLTGTGATPESLSAHRWRYALVETPLGEPCLWDSAARIGLCGDWCIGPRVEAAFLSGEALAQTVLATS